MTRIHGFELLRVVESALLLLLLVMDEVGVLGVAISEEVEGFILEPYKHYNLF